jgi:hypothetical protein
MCVDKIAIQDISDISHIQTTKREEKNAKKSIHNSCVHGGGCHSGAIWRYPGLGARHMLSGFAMP